MKMFGAASKTETCTDKNVKGKNKHQYEIIWYFHFIEYYNNKNA